MEVGEIAPTKGVAQRARSNPERIHYINQSVTPAPLPLRANAGRRLSDSPDDGLRDGDARDDDDACDEAVPQSLHLQTGAALR
jgi:hypothetical protein